MEIWKDIEGCEGKYQVSNKGRIKSLQDRGVKREKILSLLKHNSGYYSIGLMINGKCKHFLVHRLVAKAFIENPNNYNFVNHKDENKRNNDVENLEWCTKSYNAIYYLERDEARKIEYANRLRDKKTNELSSPYTKKNHVHTNTQGVVQKTYDGEVVAVYENSIDAYLKTGINFSHITRACKLNESGIPKTRNGSSGGKYVSHGFVWEYINDIKDYAM